MAEYFLEEENEEETIVGGGDDTQTGGGTDTPGSGSGSISGGSSSDDEEDDEEETETTVENTEESILNPAYVKKVKESQFGELYSRLVSDEKESQCAEFLAPQLVKQDRLFDHTSKAAFGQFY